MQVHLKAKKNTFLKKFYISFSFIPFGIVKLFLKFELN